jgi:benzoyl-CoA reductase/2-hydroxyglutaryl-CoA dehydratase subunit BcrC/BadD/HgdB
MLPVVTQAMRRLTEFDPAVLRSGESVVAYVGRDVPREVLLAAGLTPVRLAGVPGCSALADRYCDPALDEVTRTQLELVLTGQLSQCAGLVISGDCESSVRLFLSLREIQRRAPMTGVPPFTFLDFVHLPHRTSTVYNAARLDEFVAGLTTWTGQPVADARIAAQIRSANEVRTLVAALQRLRADPAGPRLTGVQALRILHAGFRLPQDTYRDLLTQLIDTSDGLPAHDGVRVFLTGSSHDHDLAYRLIEARGAIVVGEDHDWGALALGRPVDETGDVRSALVAAYGRPAPSSAGFGMAERAECTARSAAEAGAQVVVSWLRHGDDAPAQDVLAQRAALAKAGIPLVALPAQPYGGPRDCAIGDLIATEIAAVAAVGARS